MRPVSQANVWLLRDGACKFIDYTWFGPARWEPAYKKHGLWIMRIVYSRISNLGLCQMGARARVLISARRAATTMSVKWFSYRQDCEWCLPRWTDLWIFVNNLGGGKFNRTRKMHMASILIKIELEITARTCFLGWLWVISEHSSNFGNLDCWFSYDTL